MFAYCNNNPISFSDKFGRAPKKIALPICLDPEGNDPWNQLPLDRAQDNPARRGDEMIFDFISSDGLGKATLNAAMGTRKARKGIDAIVTGFNILSLPMPTPIDEFIGIGWMLKGAFQLIFSTKNIFWWMEGFK